MKKLGIVCSVLLLSACADKMVVTSYKYPDMPDMQKPLSLQLENCKWDMPRDMSITVPVNSTYCNKLNKLSSEYTITCLIHPIEQSNVYIGLDRDNWNCFISNMEKIKLHIKEYEAQLDTINEQRADWRKQNINK